MAQVRALLTACLLCTAFANNEAGQNDGLSVTDSNSKAMEDAFLRSDEVHKESMSSIFNSMTTNKAVEVLKASSLSTPELMQVADMAVGKQSNLRKQPKGYSGLDGARKLLNDMIYESMSKYDAEIAKCTDYYSRQCAAMEACRGQIAASNYVAANSRALILDAQATINRCEVDIPAKKLDLKNHNLKCNIEQGKLDARLKIVLGDIEVMTMILKMTDCDAKLLQMEKFAVLHCTDECTKKTFVQFNQEGLQQKVNSLKSTVSQELMRDTFADLFEGIEGLESVEFIQSSNKTKFNNPPVPKTKVPRNPCTDPNKGAPSAADKAAAKCTIKKSPQCYKLQERFLNIQAGIEDERDELLDTLNKLKAFCDETRNTISTEIANDEDTLSNHQTKLAAATEKEATAGEIARQTAEMNHGLEEDLQKQMKSCSGNYVNFETELCALKKIRGELYKMRGDGEYSFKDCEVAKWSPETCTKKCSRGFEGGGEQKLTRAILAQPDGGAKCLPLTAVRSCGNQPCPVDCSVSAWSGWSKCSAECGGGVLQRVREVKVAAKYGGTSCGETSETKACNTQACEKNCELGTWTKWSTCSKDCDGGSMKRERFVKHPAEGAGTCPGRWNSKRLQYKHCNQKRCSLAGTQVVKACDRTMDVVILIDGSGSLGQKGWDAEIVAAKTLVSAFKHNNATDNKAEIALILYSGPRTYSGVYKCFSKYTKKEERARVCAVKTITHFTNDMDEVLKLIDGLKWPQGSTLTSLALMTAKSELSMGRKDAKANVIVITDGKPLSKRKTGLAAEALRKGARLLWVPVTKHAPLADIKRWATRRWQENVVPVTDFGMLEKPEVITHIIANICPKEDPEIVFSRAK